MQALWPVLLGALGMLFFAPGLLVGAWLTLRHELPAIYVVPVAALAGCLFGYLTFWVFLAAPAAGRALSVVEVLLATGAIAALALRPRWRTALWNADVVLSLALLFAVALLYYGIYAGCEDTCLTAGLPVDNVVPALFAHQVAIGDPLALLGDWHYSDRPPLQTGVVLAQDLLIHNGATPPHLVRYELLGTLLQCLWVPAMWAIFRRLGLPGRGLAPALGICVGLGFFFINSVYVWPKLLPGAFAAIAVLLMVAEGSRRLTVGLAAAFTACALLAHAGVAFGLVPFAALLLWRRYRPSWRDLAVGAAAGLILLAPWWWYQRFYDPPGDRLLKWHLAGVIAVDDRSFLRALADSYTTTPLGTLIDNRIANLFFLFMPSADNLRSNEFFHVFIGLGLLNVGFVLLTLPAVRRALTDQGVDRRLLTVLLVGAGTGLLLWCLVMFVPSSTLIHQSSYLTMMLLIAVPATAVGVLPRWASWSVVGAQAVSFMAVWVAGPLAGNRSNLGSLAAAFVGLAAVVALLWYVHHAVSPAGTTPPAKPATPGSADASPATARAPAA